MREAAIKTGLFSKFRPKIAQLVLGLALAFASLLNSVQASGPVPSATFATEAAAQAHCPSDAVVWLNTNTGIYHEKGMRWYGRTKHGAYVCRKRRTSLAIATLETGNEAKKCYACRRC